MNSFDITDAMIDRDFSLHPPGTPEVASKMDYVRTEFTFVTQQVMSVLPTSKEKTIAFRKIREALMYSIAALACNQDDVDV